MVESVGFAKAKFRVSGDRDCIEDTAIVDIGSLLSVIDESVAERLGLKPTGRVVKLTTFMCGVFKFNALILN
jgi:predicted aspartyl protease